ncbi:DUF4349 domain-containing protein [Leptospira ellisii]|uniref:DUF4349 domain-containing protein n=1 Tax=Leptospira ellisii TaxID=2023197 RepID=A0A2N0BAD4_9LEPT|nr:DUF4349 domain-containing protein [Leptospira ellisii]MDV6235795.1 DUF4349 domain-containing protein [Leptospira ellisii]PJZ93505.1 hypothetical protein CH379_07490 [Leptospira ellisii]PKA04388.1 hypothetical protein CH375_11260 [Leptospira ellisii]
MKRDFKTGAIVAGSVFALLFLFRLTYGYVSGSKPSGEFSDNNRSFLGGETSFNKQNIATKRIRYENAGSPPKSVDQKYEKVATIESLSPDIEGDEKKVRDLINSTGSIIQYENSSGLKQRKNRIVKLAVGVPPEKFDPLVQEFKQIGKTLLLTIDKKDKTNEYKDLQAKKESLLKIRASLNALKNKGGRIDEYVSLENRILEIEDEIQKLGISLGEFDSENEFCTVLLTLYENKASDEIGFLHRVKVALEWTIKYYLLLTFASLFAILSFYYSFPLWERIKTLLPKRIDP